MSEPFNNRGGPQQMFGNAIDLPEPPATPRLFQDYIDINDALDGEEPALEFVFPGFLCATMGTLISVGGAGKSMISMQIAVSVAAGLDAWSILGGNPKAGPVLIVSAEDPRKILKKRLRSLNKVHPELFTAATRANLKIKAVQGLNWTLGTWDGVVFSRSTNAEELRLEIKQLKPRLVIFDTLNRLLGGINENDNSAQGRVFSDIEQLLAATETAGLVLHHTTKSAALSGQGGEQQAARGAGAITDNCRWQMNLIPMSKEEAENYNFAKGDTRKAWVQASVTKINYAAPPEAIWLHRDSEGTLSVQCLPPFANGGGHGKLGKNGSGKKDKSNFANLRKPNTRGDAFDGAVPF
jgi:RecA-family ATPase